MPQKPRSHRTKASGIKTLKSRTDAHRYNGPEWRQARMDVLARDPVCYCGLYRYFCEETQSVRVHQDMNCDGTIAPAVLVDHIRALSRGGDHSLGNLQSLCSKCHRNKTRLYN